MGNPSGPCVLSFGWEKTASQTSTKVGALTSKSLSSGERIEGIMLRSWSVRSWQQEKKNNSENSSVMAEEMLS